MKSKEKKSSMWLLFPLMLLCWTSCGERRTEVRLEGGNPPTFALSGSGNLIGLSVGLQLQDKRLKPSQRVRTFWEIVPTTRDGETVESIGQLKYGVVPPGYKQKTPVDGQPPPLQEENIYYYYFETINAPHASGTFVIRDGKAVRVYGVAVCYRVENGNEIEVPCYEQ